MLRPQFIRVTCKWQYCTNEAIFVKKKPEGYWDDEQNVLQFLSKLQKELNLNSMKDWNSINQKQIKLFGGSSILKKYSLFDLKCMAYPEGKKHFNKPIKYKPTRFWEKNENILNFLNNIKEKLNLNSPEDWNLITSKQIIFFGGRSLFYKYSLYDLKCIACPEGKYLFKKSPKSSKYWDNKENIIHFLHQIKEKLNLNDWNLLSRQHVIDNGGISLFKKYSLSELKLMVSSDVNIHKSIGFWENKQNILNFLNELKLKYNFNSPEDWNLLNRKQIQLNGGNSLLVKYSLFELKCLACPEGKLLFNKSMFKYQGYWDDEQNVLHFLNELKVIYNLNTPEDWNLLNGDHIVSNNGTSLLKKYSMFELKCLGCPEGKNYFDLMPKPSGYWDDENNIIQFMEKLKNNYNLKTSEDWSRLSVNQIKSFGGDGLIRKYSLKELIQLYNSNLRININNNKKSSQRWLFLQVQKLFPDEEIVEDYFHSELSRCSGSSVQFDVFILHKNIAIEYHGKHHYEDIPSGFAPIEMFRLRDKEKQLLCQQYGIKLIIIPYWWDNRPESLLETINEAINTE